MEKIEIIVPRTPALVWSIFSGDVDRAITDNFCPNICLYIEDKLSIFIDNSDGGLYIGKYNYQKSEFDIVFVKFKGDISLSSLFSYIPMEYFTYNWKVDADLLDDYAIPLLVDLDESGMPRRLRLSALVDRRLGTKATEVVCCQLAIDLETLFISLVEDCKLECKFQSTNHKNGPIDLLPEEESQLLVRDIYYEIISMEIRICDHCDIKYLMKVDDTFCSNCKNTMIDGCYCRRCS